jgi:hypothetical protein
MICTDCQVGGDFNAKGNYDKAEELHGYCKGDCGCHHKTGAGWYVRKDQKPTLMQTQSP